jgi:thiamine biosynthesis lipoprotein
MPAVSRRRFIAISAAALAAGGARAAPATRWTGVALGARTAITLAHPEAARLVAAARDEVARLEAVFSLYRATSALSCLNRDGALDAPPMELVECLGIAGAVHAATGGAFDPTVQPLWRTYAQAFAAGHAPDEGTIAAARNRVGWAAVDVAPDRVAFRRPGMEMTLNGIAQGYIADRVTRLLEEEGLRDILVDTGELRATGGMPGGGAWPVQLPGGRDTGLRDRALATSAPLGTAFDAAGRVGHILDPRSGYPAPAYGRSVTVTAPTAALADALSTALCLLGESDGDLALGAFRGCRRIAA